MCDIPGAQQASGTGAPPLLSTPIKPNEASLAGLFTLH